MLGDTILDYQVTVLIGLHDITTEFNLESENNQGVYRHEKRETIAWNLRHLADENELKGNTDVSFYNLNLNTWFGNVFQRMITLIDEIKNLTNTGKSEKSTQELLDRMESLNFSKPGETPRTHEFQQSLMENANAKSLHKLNHPTIAMYNHARLMYNMINDDLATRDEAREAGEDELAHFIGSKNNLEFFDNSHDVHLKLASSFIKKTLNWMNVVGGVRGTDVGKNQREGEMFDVDDDMDIE